mmetsp:Transcript_31114/g.95221  ORF Transcript_31114/g.95221 Transcript_31114/m.95221 type:complete len:264 (-) Transcript_31114:1143-1934(-)
MDVRASHMARSLCPRSGRYCAGWRRPWGKARSGSRVRASFPTAPRRHCSSCSSTAPCTCCRRSTRRSSSRNATHLRPLSSTDLLRCSTGSHTSCCGLSRRRRLAGRASRSPPRGCSRSWSSVTRAGPSELPPLGGCPSSPPSWRPSCSVAGQLRVPELPPAARAPCSSASHGPSHLTRACASSAPSWRARRRRCPTRRYPSMSRATALKSGASSCSKTATCSSPHCRRISLRAPSGSSSSQASDLPRRASTGRGFSRNFSRKR